MTIARLMFKNGTTGRRVSLCLFFYTRLSVEALVSVEGPVQTLKTLSHGSRWVLYSISGPRNQRGFWSILLLQEVFWDVSLIQHNPRSCKCRRLRGPFPSVSFCLLPTPSSPIQDTHIKPIGIGGRETTPLDRETMRNRQTKSG